ncbi:MAG: chemotaxis protein CheW [Campylobacterales bacterium]|nr:chemotaxis protein CheW [Campylobacterales bacterium]
MNDLQELHNFIKHMDSVKLSKEKLDELSRNWDTLSLLSQLGEAGMNMNKIKGDFVTLSNELINYFGREMLQKTVSEMSSKAQVSVDIVIRNLFERTADIGFLATDEAIRDFLRKNPTIYSDGYHDNLTELKKRFVEYAKKYSVYFDIVLMNPQGNILASIEDNEVSKSHDPLLQEVAYTSQEYVETYRHHDFLPHHDKSLVYSYRVTKSDSSDELLGVLCLCFKFEDEMDGIFANLINPKTKECLTLLDERGEVIATSDKYHIPIGAKLPSVFNAPYEVVTFGGRDYLAKSAKTNGYQGFFGLGWQGHIMVPLEHAFYSIDEEEFAITQQLLLAILQHSDLFAESLKAIPLQAEEIQHNLNRAIWNGNVKQNNSGNENKQFSKALLQEIRKTGAQTKHIIADSMAKLTKTMVLSDGVFLADLILDIMDRNLYERANDCRWWALTPDFRSLLSMEQVTPSASQRMSEILAHINSLYTVYTNLFIYDVHGKIVAVSQKSAEYLLGTKLSAKWVQESLSLTNTSKYCVSDFTKSSLYENRHTYIYNAAIRSQESEDVVVGGIGIVFDSELQFAQMIEESLPKNKHSLDKDTLFCVLTTKEQNIIASNHSKLSVGEHFEIDPKFYSLKNGESLSEIIEYQGDYYALGVKCSKGYREYKSPQDDYQNCVYSFVFSYISNVAQTAISMEEEESADILQDDISGVAEANSVEVASFMIGSKWLGVRTEEVVEAMSISALNSTITMEEGHHFKGTMMYKDSMISVIDIQKFVQEKHSQAYEEIIVLKFGEKGFIGILVNSLDAIPSVKKENIKTLDEYVIGNGTLVTSMVFPPKDSPSQEVLSLLNIQKIQENLVAPNLTHMNKR